MRWWGLWSRSDVVVGCGGEVDGGDGCGVGPRLGDGIRPMVGDVG